ncbi:NACHT domain-containing protein [Kitasatospora sp. NPDC094019]|uniref:NACHT domain-containing protein n=1 Tax=Kitasatospora sp. NPDC094019 TaxID=3364091 RepID=UPI003824AF58
MTNSAAATFHRMEGFYAAGGTRSVQESFSALDFEVRFLALLAASTLRATGLPMPPIGRSPGLGEWISLLRDLRSRLDGAEAGGTASRVRHAVTSALARYDEGIPGAPSGLRATKQLRDHVSHGGAIPPGLSHTVDALVRAISDIVAACLADATVSLTDTGDTELRPAFVWPDTEVGLWPFLYVTTDDSWHVFSRFVGDDPSFLAFGTPGYRSTLSAGPIPTSLNQLLKPRHQSDSQDPFRRNAERDLRAFADLIAPPPEYFDHGQGFGYEWGKSTSGGTEHRRDYFRHGPDGPQWRDENAWVPYRDYLRRLANWPVVAGRLSRTLDQIERRITEEESEQLGWKPQIAAQREAHVKVTDYDGTNAQQQRFAELIDGVDDDLGVEKGTTQVVFINGEAGIGKTRAMVKAARDRAREVEQNEGNATGNLPLFLYVRSTGRVLDGLDAAVNDAVIRTENLNEERVKTLCRNGLVALLIDGFDELLGGAAYSDALDSLKDWLNALGGRGVLVVSARSSYYVNQYRSSVQRAKKQGAAVRHRVAEVLRWTPDQIRSFLDDYGVPATRFQNLSPADKELLGLPFFTRAFAEMCRAGDYDQESGTVTSFTERLLDHYILREERKLTPTSGNAAGLLDRGELRRTFEYVAEIMAESHEREVDSDELEMAATIALDLADVEELDNREGLRDRLQVLCGLAAGATSNGPTRFRFQHELFFDYFLAGIVTRHLDERRLAAFQRLLSRSEWRTATVNAVAAAVDPTCIVEALTDFPPKATRQDDGFHDSVLATNLGSLWSALIRHTREIPSTPILGATFTDPLDLTDVKADSAKLVDCQMEKLILPETDGWRIKLDGTHVKKITTGVGRTDLTGLSGVVHKEVVELYLRPDRYWSRRQEILEALLTCEAAVVDAPAPSNGTDSVLAEASRHYLRHLMEHAQSTLILKDDHQPEDHRLKWTQEYEGEWKRFISALRDSDLARLENLAAKGSKKVRLRLNLGAALILDESSEEPRIRAFWESVER